MAADRARFRMAISGGAGGLSPVSSGQKGAAAAAAAVGIGPGSNTGQKGQEDAIIDYLTFVVPLSALEEVNCKKLDLLLFRIFGFRGEVVAGAIRQKHWNFYEQSAVLIDRENEVVGRVGIGGKHSSVCISLTGMGCKWIRDRARVFKQLTMLGGKITRVDCAHDDYEGERLDVHALREVAAQGGFTEGGCPPRHRFISDEGHDTGCTLYVGGKGHKELCVYEKGKAEGLPTSRWVRAEVRLYGKHMEIPLDVLLNPGAYLRGAYSALQDLIQGVCTRMRTIRKQVEVSAEAMVLWLERQVGPALSVLRGAFGDSWSDFVEARIVRDGHPGRFRGIAKGDALHRFVREELCLSAA